MQRDKRRLAALASKNTRRFDIKAKWKNIIQQGRARKRYSTITGRLMSNDAPVQKTLDPRRIINFALPYGMPSNSILALRSFNGSLEEAELLTQKFKDSLDAVNTSTGDIHLLIGNALTGWDKDL